MLARGLNYNHIILALGLSLSYLDGLQPTSKKIVTLQKFLYIRAY